MSPIQYPKCCSDELDKVQAAWDMVIGTYPDNHPTDPLTAYCPNHGFVNRPKSYDPTSHTDHSSEIPIDYIAYDTNEPDTEPDIIIERNKLSSKALCLVPVTIALRLAKRLATVSVCSSRAMPATWPPARAQQQYRPYARIGVTPT